MQGFGRNKHTLKKIAKSAIKEILEKYFKQTIPDENNNVNSGYETALEKIRASLGDNNFYIIVDAITDACGRYIAHLMIGALQKDKATNPNSFLATRQN